MREKLDAQRETAIVLGQQPPNTDQAPSQKRAATLVMPAVGPESRRKRRRKGQVPNDHPSPAPRRSFVPLNTTPDRILRLRRDELGSPAPLTKDPAKRDRSRFCEYHKDHGHMMIECNQLKKRIDSLIRGGDFHEFVAYISKTLLSQLRPLNSRPNSLNFVIASFQLCIFLFPKKAKCHDNL